MISMQARALIEHECRRLSLEFARLNDSAQYEAVAALFTPDGVFYRPLTPELKLCGRQAILTELRRKPKDVISHHACGNILIDVLSEDEAVGLTYFTVYRQQGAATLERPFCFEGTVYIGAYNDRFRHTDDGWAISERRGFNKFFFDASSIHAV